MFDFLNANRSLSRRFGVIPLLFALALTLVAPLRVLGSDANGGQKASAQAAPPDLIVFTNGDQLTGKLLRAANGTVTFHSDIVGDVNVAWDKIKSICSSQKFAVIQQGQKLSRKTPDSQVPQGTIEVQDGQVRVTPEKGAEETEIPAKNAQYVIDESTYTKELHGHPGFSHGWIGSVTAGASQVEATQNSQTFTVAATAVRTVPNVSWLSPQNRTIFNFNSAYGSLTSPNTPTVKTNIIQGSAEQDWYLSPRLYALVTAAFDHNYSQGLDLQQIYGGGIGFTVHKDAKQELDLKGDVHFERQAFGYTPGVEPPVFTPSKNLIGIDVGDTYTLKLPHNMLFNQSLIVSPAFNDEKAISGVFIAGLAFPVYKRFSFTLGMLDDFLNDPAVGSKRNSFQYTGGLTYTF